MQVVPDVSKTSLSQSSCRVVTSLPTARTLSRNHSVVVYRIAPHAVSLL